jgi:hypothetical protein
MGSGFAGAAIGLVSGCAGFESTISPSARTGRSPAGPILVSTEEDRMREGEFLSGLSCRQANASVSNSGVSPDSPGVPAPGPDSPDPVSNSSRFT